ncbi:hypothetical protein LCGC14_3123130, partial [marine sediment metagenome]
DIGNTLATMEDALEVVKKNWKNPLKALKGKVAKETFRLYVYKK